MRNRRTSFLILLMGLLLTVVGAAGARAGEPERSPRPAKDVRPDRFEDLADAAARDAIDPELAKRLEGGEPVTAFAVLDGTDVLAAYGDGSRRSVPAAKAVLAKMRDEVQRDVHLEVVRAYDIVPLLLVRIEHAEHAVALLNLPLVLSITADNENEHALAQSLPQIRQPQVRAGGLRGGGAAVAVLDTGLDFTQFAFGPCSAPGTPATAGGTCRVAKAFDTPADDGARDANPDQHGTNVAGIVAGVAPAARLIGIDVFAGATAWDHDIIAGLDWVLQHRASEQIRAVNLSLAQKGTWYTGACDGGIFTRNPYVYSFTLLRSAGVVPVVAAGNRAFWDGQFQDGIAAPACTVGAFSVGAVYNAGPNSMTWGDPSQPRGNCTDTNVPFDSLTCFSQDGPQLGVLAPGASITAAGTTLGGTSQAAPHVAGAAAILAAARPFSTVQELEGFIRTSATTITDPRSNRSHPRLDLVSAVRAAFPVPNDDRAAATPLTAWGGHYGQTTWTATKESGEPMHAANAGGASVWFRWTASRTGTATFSTQGSDYDTLLAVYRVAANGALVPVASADDVVGSTTSAVQFPVSANDVLLIAVDGKAITPTVAASGHLRLTTNLPHDDIAGALPISPGSPQTSANIGATRQAGEPAHCGDSFARKSVWYRWTPSVASTATVRAAGSSTLCVAVYETSASAAAVFGLLSPVASAADDQGYPAEAGFAATPGRSYWIAVDGVSHETACNPVTGQCNYATTEGTFSLSLTAP